MRILYIFLLCIIFSKTWATVEELATTIKNQSLEIGPDLATSTLVHLYQQVGDGEKEDVIDAYADMKNIKEDQAKEKLEKAVASASQAQVQAPAGVSDSFKAVVDKVAQSKTDDIPEYTADALRYLFGDEPKTMDLPDAAKNKAKEQPGYQLEQAAQVEATFSKK